MAGSNYLVTVPIKKTIQPGGRDSLAIRIGVAKSSVHDFSLRLLGGTAAIDSSPIHMEVFIPTSGAKYIQGR